MTRDTWRKREKDTTWADTMEPTQDGERHYSSDVIVMHHGGHIHR